MSNLISPLAHFWIYLLFALIAWFFKWHKTARVLTVGAFLVLFIFTISPWPVYMVRDLEQRYPVYKPASADSNLTVLVLGAAHVNDPQLPPLQRLSIPVLDRVAEGIRIKNIHKGKIVFSGFSRMNNSPHATVMAESAVSLGVSPADTAMLIKPKNTWEEAKAFKQRYGASKKLILVTSAVHLPRAMQIFKDMGMDPIPAPANFINRNEPSANPYNWWPSSIKSMYTEIAMYEYVSTWYYKWKVRE